MSLSDNIVQQKIIVKSLKTEKEFQVVSKSGVKYYANDFIMIVSDFMPVVKLDDNPSFYLGMKVSKKFSKKAVDRNKVKRRIRHIARDFDKSFGLSLCNKAIVVIPRKNFLNEEFAKLQQDFISLFKKSIFVSNIKDDGDKKFQNSTKNKMKKKWV